MGYITAFDYKVRIQDPQLIQITSNDMAIKLECELLAMDIFKSNLVQKYDVNAEFTDTTQYINTKIYNANTLVYLDGQIYDALAVYSSNTNVLYNTLVYIKNSTVATVGTLPTNSTYFTLIGAQHAYYNTIVPYPFWTYLNTYRIGDKTFYKNKVYTALGENVSVAPDDLNYGLNYWGAGVIYSVAAGTITDITKWQAGDNRNPQCVNYMIDVIIYELMTRISPKMVPQIRKDRADFVTNVWLEDCARGETITLDIPRLPFRQGARIRFSSNIKNNNSY